MGRHQAGAAESRQRRFKAIGGGAAAAAADPDDLLRLHHGRRAASRLHRLLFYRSKSPGYVESQSVTSVGIVEAVTDAHSLEELVRLTARRSVYSTSQLEGFARRGQIPSRSSIF